MMADFHLTIDSMWCSDGTFEIFEKKERTETKSQNEIKLKREYNNFNNI